RLANFVAEHGLGWVLSNDTGVITERSPDTVRGADIAYYSFARVPRGSLPRTGYLPVAPDLVVEVRSHTGRWSHVFLKVGEFLNVGVPGFVVLDPQTRPASISRGCQSPQFIPANGELAVPDVLGDFHVPLRCLFE